MVLDFQRPVLSVGTALLLALLLLCLWLTSLVRSWYRLRHVPGPPLAGVSGVWMIRMLARGRSHEHMCDLPERYGSLVRIGPNDLLCSDPETLRRMSGVRSPYTKGDFYKTGQIIPGRNNVVSERDEAAHKALRAKMYAAYLGKESGGSSGIEFAIDRQLVQLVSLIDAKYISEPGALRPFDLAAKSQYFALDVISDVSFGSPFGFLQQDKDLYNYIEINDSAVPAINVLAGAPWLTKFIYRWPLKLVLPSDGDNVGFGRLMGLAKGFVEQRLRPEAEAGRDMLQAFINGGMTYDELIQHMFVQIVAGSITTAAAIRHTVLAITSNPAIYQTLQQEIDKNIASGHISNPVITDLEAQALPYLQAVIRESLRMWPPTTGLGSKQVPKGGDFICGYHVPAGTQIAHNFSGTMRLRSLWGDDADVYRPERWLEAEKDPEKLKCMNSVIELCFGSGKYQCLGKRIALMELSKIFVELLRRYNLALVDPHKPIQTSSGVFWICSDMKLRVTTR